MNIKLHTVFLLGAPQKLLFLQNMGNEVLSPTTISNSDDEKEQYLSPSAKSALSSSSFDDGYDGLPSPSSPLTVSPHSSAPSSPRHSFLNNSNGNAIESTVSPPDDDSNNNTVCPQALLEEELSLQREKYDGKENSKGDDPYSDVRIRMEALSLRDKMKHVHHNEQYNVNTTTAEAYSVCSPHQDITIFAAITTYLGYVVLIVTGHIRDMFANIFRKGRYLRSNKANKSGGIGNEQKNDEVSPSSTTGRNYPSDDFTRYAPLLKSWENFYTRRLYHRIQDCFNRPIASRPSAIISVLERVSFDGNKTMSVLGKLSNLNDTACETSYQSGQHYNETPDGRVVRKCLNLGSYNYLGFADDWDVTCRTDVIGSLQSLPSSVGSSRLEFGTTSLHRKVEKIVSTFVGKEDALVLNMGFNTNATIIPTLTSRGDLIVSDELNHTSIVNGARASGAAIRTFRHNDSNDLELILREAIVYGQPRTRRPWNRILVVVEGIYSMEGEYCDLRNVVKVCKKYGAYVYLDEAHSIGASE